MNQTQLDNIRREIESDTYDESLGMDATVDGVLRDIVSMGDRPGPVEFEPPIEESEP